jgi:hypothetical protein
MTATEQTTSKDSALTSDKQQILCKVRNSGIGKISAGGRAPVVENGGSSWAEPISRNASLRGCSWLKLNKAQPGSGTPAALLGLLCLLPLGIPLALLILVLRKSSASPIASGCMSSSAGTSSTASDRILTASTASDLQELFFRKPHLENQSVQSRRSRRPFLGLRSGASYIWRLRGWR